MDDKVSATGLVLPEGEKKYTLSELIDINLLQELQDNFSATTGIASITVDKNGSVTKPSYFSEHCKIIRESPLGFEKCKKSYTEWEKIAQEKGNTLVYVCYAGMTNFIVPIIINGIHIGSIFGGQVISEELNNEKIKNNAKELCLNEETYLKTVKKIRIIPKKNIEAAAELLFTVANAISEIALKNLKLIEQKKRKKIYTNIAETIRNTPDISETKEKIVEIIGKMLHADRCFIGEYDKNTQSYKDIYNEYLSGKDILPYKGTDVNKDVPKFAELLKEGKNIIINNKKIYSTEHDREFHMEKIAIEKNNVTSAFAFPLYYQGDFIGFLALHYVKEQHYIKEEEMELLEAIANQISIAINRANIFDSLKQTTENQNAILNNIPHMAWLKDLDSNYITVNTAFAKLCHSEISDMIGKNDFNYFPYEHALAYRNDDIKVIETKKGIKAEELIEYEGKSRWHETYKSPIFDPKGNVVGTVGMATDITERKEHEFKLLEHQKKIEIANEREKINRSITEILRSSLDKGMIKHLFVENIGKAFKADRVLFSEFDPVNKIYLPVEKEAQYLSSPEIKSFAGYDWSNPEAKDYISELLEKREISIPSWDEYITYNSKLDGFKRLFEDSNVKSSYNFPVLYQEEIMGYFCIEYTRDVNRLSSEDIQMIRNICTQAGIAMYHSRLYRNAKKSSESKGEFIANIAKDAEIALKKVMATEDEIIDEKAKLYSLSKYFEKSKETLLELRNDLILISKIEAENFTLNYESIDLDETTREIIKLLNPKLNNKNVNFSCKIEEKVMNSDKKIIYHILYNLIYILFDSIQNNGVLKLKIKAINGKMEIEMEENVNKKDIEAQNKVFEYLKQLDFNFPRKEYGKGLKLPITRKLVEILKGTISVDSNESTGIRVKVILPNS